VFGGITVLFCSSFILTDKDNLRKTTMYYGVNCDDLDIGLGRASGGAIAQKSV